MALVSGRNPYPFPKLQNDTDFCGVRPEQKGADPLPTHLAQQEDPWNRLSAKHTLSSSRHEVYHFDSKAPNDFLDFVLKSKYNQHEKFLKNKNEVLFQRETFDEDHAGRKLKNRVVVVPKVPPLMNHPLTITEHEKHISEHSVKNAIESHHTQTTNKGYTRKPDGGFFTS